MGYLDELKKDGESQEPRPRRLIGAKRLVRDIMPPEPSPPPPTGGPPPPPPPAIRHRPLRPTLPLPRPAAEAGEELAVRTWEPEARRRARRRRRAALYSTAALLLAAFIVPTLAFPKLTITLHPKLHTIPVTRLELTADAALTAPDAAARRIPAISLTAEETLSQEYESSGRKFFQERARGTVLLTNAFSSAPQTLVAQTRLQDPSGKVFRLRLPVLIPGAAVAEGKIVPTSIAAEVIADAPGADYNIGPTEFRIPGFRGTPKYQAFSARSEGAMQGGFVGEARVVQEEDLKRASEDVTRRLAASLRRALDGKVPPGSEFVAPEGAREIAVVELSAPRAGERAERFSVSAKGRGRLMAVRADHLAAVAGQALLPPGDLTAKVPARQPELRLEEVRLEAEKPQLRFALAGTLRYWREANPAELAATLKSSTPRKAEAYLRGRDEIEAFRVKRFPFWLWFIPSRPGGLELSVAPPA